MISTVTISLILTSAALLAVVSIPRVATQRWIFGVVLVYAISATTWYNWDHNPHLVLWLCNFTAFFALILFFKFHQGLFNIFFYFVWTGDVFTLLIINNPICPPINTYPLSWLGFYLKHVTPLLFSIYLLRVEKKRLSQRALFMALATMLVYTGLMAIYNVVFNQNILDLRYPTLPIEEAFGPWPWYVVVNFTIAIAWYLVIHFISRRLRIVAVKKPRASAGAPRG